MATESRAKWRELRERARTDLFWLAREVLGYRDLVETVHQPLAEFFVKKDRNTPFEAQDSVKQRLILDPRDHFKTTFDIADIVQWILNFPDIRILIMTGTRELASRMLREAKWHFQQNERLRKLFPEYAAPTKDWGTTEEFTITTRRKTHLREPTVSISTIDSVKAGSHYDLIKCDDLVNEINSQTTEQIEKVITAFNHTTPVLEPYGYRDVIGTRYDYSDLYGWIIDGNKGEWKVFARRACTFNDDGSVKSVLFKERFTPERLIQIRRADNYLFNCQYLNDPTPTEQKHFTRDLLLRHSLPAPQIQPQERRVFIAWDLGFSQKSYADWSVAAVGMYDERGRLFILELLRGRFSPHELVQHIAHLYLKWLPVRIGIEKAGGSELLEPALRAWAVTNNIHLPLDWLPVKVQKDAKIKRIAGLESMLRQDQLFFAAHVITDDLIHEFERFPKYKHDDIPDAISLLLHYRQMVDIQWPNERVTMTSAQVAPGCDVLGAGLVG